MRLLDSRRLTGANLFLSGPGAVIDVAVDDRDGELLVAAWRRHVRYLLEDIDWSPDLAVRPFEGGVSLAIAAPPDGLYTATELNEAAWEAARDLLEGGQRHLLRRAARQLRSAYRDEERPRLKRLLEAARERGVEVLLDEELLTLGSGRYGQSWDLYELPHPDDVDWKRLRSVPTVLITGTNGKTTTTRLLASIAAAAKRTAGVSSTDWLAIGDELLDRDDYAGPGGARRVLRDRRCELALLETARGGLLRRGLAMERADVALITNISSDHLGDYGVETIEDLADVKWTVTRALDGKGVLVLNAEDPLLLARAKRGVTGKLLLFSLDPRNAFFTRHIEAGGTGVTVSRGRIVRMTRREREGIVGVRSIPVTFNGTASYNVANALAATAVALALGVASDSIAKGLGALRNADNPGRGNLYTVDGITVLLDFAHNPAGLRALMPVVTSLPAKRCLLVTGQAGDRSDEDIRDFARAAGDFRFDRVLIKRMDGHGRGRPTGEVAKLLKRAFRAEGYPAASIGLVKSELGAVQSALRWAQPGDLVDDV